MKELDDHEEGLRVLPATKRLRDSPNNSSLIISVQPQRLPQSKQNSHVGRRDKARHCTRAAVALPRAGSIPVASIIHIASHVCRRRRGRGARIAPRCAQASERQECRAARANAKQATPHFKTRSRGILVCLIHFLFPSCRHIRCCGECSFFSSAPLFSILNSPRRDQEEEELLKERLCEHQGRVREAVVGPFGLHVQTVQDKGRGVFTEQAIAAGEFVIGPFTLCFSPV